MNIDDIFRPMNIITNYESYKKILKKYKKEITDSASLEDNEKILNQCKKELDSFYSKIMWKSVGILIVYLLFVLITCYFTYLEFNWIMIAIGAYILLFIIEKYYTKYNVYNELLEYVSNIGFVDINQIEMW